MTPASPISNCSDARQRGRRAHLEAQRRSIHRGVPVRGQRQIAEFDLKKLMGEQPHRDCIADGLSRLLGIAKEDAASRIQAEGGVSQVDISNRWQIWHAAFRTAGLKREAFPQAPRPTLEELAKTIPSFIARVWDHLVTVIDGQPFEACGNAVDMGRKPNHYWIVDDGAESASGLVEQNGNA